MLDLFDGLKGARHTDIFCDIIQKLEPELSRTSIGVVFQSAMGGRHSSQKADHFVDKHTFHLIHKVRNIEPILDELLTKRVIRQESYEKIRNLQTTEEKMRELFDDLKGAGDRDKDILFDIIQKLEPRVIEDTLPGADVMGDGGGHSLQKQNILMDVKESSLAFSTSAKMAKGSQTSPEDEWIKLEPEVNCMAAPIYSLQSEAGNFECSVSGLRWVCAEKVSFNYHFGSWEEHMDRLEAMQYMAGGPLLDVTVIAGKLDEVYLPHWICTDDSPSVLGKFAVLHIDTCGDFVEQASEVTPSHVRLSQPVFSPRGVLMKAGFPVKINCKVLIYKTKKTFLTLHVYLIPHDPALIQTLKHKESSCGYQLIEKPHPSKSLKMRDRFILTTNEAEAEICPEYLKLVYDSSDPNFFEVFIKNPDSDFKLTLTHESAPVWTCAIRKDDTGDQNTCDIQVKYDKTLDKLRPKLVQKMSRELINQLLDDLLEDRTLNDGQKDSILQQNNTSADRARCLIDMVKKKGREASRKMFFHLQRRDPALSAELGLPPGLAV